MAIKIRICTVEWRKWGYYNKRSRLKQKNDEIHTPYTWRC